jgi:alpha-ketoglutarate-dependent taurine dioxygenase
MLSITADSAAPLRTVTGRRERDLRGGLAASGAILCRGFPPVSDADFREILTRFGGPVLEYSERSSPRRQLSERVYSSTEYPSDQEIFYHNENSYQVAWPRVLGFTCREAADSGGATRLADCRQVLARIPPGILAQFERHGWCYTRNFRQGLGLSWQEVFRTSARDEVDKYCRSHGLRADWIGASRLRVTSDRRRAVVAHPGTGERVWFNHAAFFHHSTLPAEIAEALHVGVAAEDLPSNSYLGNGETVSPESMAAVRQAYRAVAQPVDWEPGDVLIIDNMLTAHSRSPFTGNRQVSVAMAGLIQASDVSGRAAAGEETR